MKEKESEKDVAQREKAVPVKKGLLKYTRPEILSITRKIGVGMPPGGNNNPPDVY